MTYDYIIVGAGSAGCVLAHRLTEDADVRVLLLEAGGNDAHPYIRVPMGLGMITKHQLFDWGYSTEPEPGLGGRALAAPRGKVLGGSSSINVMAFTRGHPDDYDGWARGGARGWSYDEVLPYFKRSETWEGGGDAYRGGDGPIGVEFARSSDPLFDAWLDSARALGFPYTDDYNGARPVGFGRAQFSIRNGRRSSTAAAYLRPVLRRPNLTVVTGALAHRLRFEGTRAVGIVYERAGALVEARAAREVLLAAGAFNSPQLLMLSGIGPADHLREIGIAPRVDLPVGRNLQDHLSVALFWRRRERGAFHALMRADRAALGMARAYVFGSGPATTIPFGLHAFVKTDAALAVPDIEFMFRGAPPVAGPWFPGAVAPYEDGFGILAAMLHPRSRGAVALRSADPHEAMRIRYAFFSAPEDLAKLRQGFQLARDLAHEHALDAYRGTELRPGLGTANDAEADAYIRETAQTISHPVSTCRMGTDAESVVDPELRVYGIDGLRVVDAAAMPELTSAHCNACVIMMAERASDLIRGRSPLLSTSTPVAAEPRAL